MPTKDFFAFELWLRQAVNCAACLLVPGDAMHTGAKYRFSFLFCWLLFRASVNQFNVLYLKIIRIEKGPRSIPRH